MGLDRNKRTPCGFCFVEYYTKDDALSCVKYINGTKLDDRVIRADLDVGFAESRQFGRGPSGGQIRDEYRVDYDPGRGGYGKTVARENLVYTGNTRAEPAKLDAEAGQINVCVCVRVRACVRVVVCLNTLCRGHTKTHTARQRRASETTANHRTAMSHSNSNEH
jgi:hypothetical protein